MGVPPEANFIDPLVALTAIACNTKKLRLGTGVNILSQTNPLLLAKQAASLDLVSGGRFMLGVGIGWLKEEFRAMGVPFERRGARFDDYVEAMKKVWSGEVVEHKSDFLDWTGFKSHPVPTQKPHLPVVIGGSKGKAFERVAELRRGLVRTDDRRRQPCADARGARRRLRDYGRDYSAVEITSMWDTKGGMDAIKAFEDIGVARVVSDRCSCWGGTRLPAFKPWPRISLRSWPEAVSGLLLAGEQQAERYDDGQA